MSEPKPKADVALDASRVLNATVVDRRDLNEFLSIVRVRPDGGVVPSFAPGQFATLGLPREPRPEEVALLQKHGKTPRVRLVRRAYSIASPPSQTDSLEFLVTLVEEGKLTPRLWNVGQGGRLWMHDEIKGEFTLDAAPPGKDLVMVSTGTGVAPFLSMYRAYRNTGRWRRLALIHGVRRIDDLAYRGELEQAERDDATFRYLPLVSRATPEEWPGARGRVQTLLENGAFEERLGFALNPVECNVFLCGNPQMIDDVQTRLEQTGFALHTRDAPGQIHFERYW